MPEDVTILRKMTGNNTMQAFVSGHANVIGCSSRILSHIIPLSTQFYFDQLGRLFFPFLLRRP